MNICYIASDVVVPHHRGASTHTLELSRHLAKRGHIVHLLCRKGGSQAEKEEIEGVRVYRIHDGIILTNPYSSYRRKTHPTNGTNPSMIRKLYELYFTKIYPIYAGLKAAQIVRSSRCEVILERETSFGAGALASYLTGCPLVMEIVGPRYSMLSAKRAMIILYYNPSMIKKSIEDSKLWHVSAATDPELFRYNQLMRESIRSSLRISNKVVIGYLGTFAEWQGIADIIKAASYLCRKHPFLHFLMIGPYYQNAKRQVEQSNLMEYFTFRGEVNYEEVPYFLSACDILLAPYNPDYSLLRKYYGIGSSMKIFDYMACSRPVIASALYPITEEVSDGQEAILIPPGDVDALASSIERLMADPEEQARLGKAGRMLVEQKYSWNAFARDLEEKMNLVLQPIDKGKS